MLAIIEKWEKNVDNGAVFGALLTDLSKTFDCIPHDLIIGKLEAYGFHIDALKFIYDYLSNRKLRVRVGVPQGYILGPLSFNINLCDLFCYLEDLDIASYADDTTIFAVNEKKSQSLVH